MFENRCTAGRSLVARLAQYRGSDLVVVGLPRGGVVVAEEVARGLAAPLDVIVVRKLRAPDDPELGIGALVAGVAPEVVLDDEAIARRGVPPEYVAEEVEAQLRHARLREALLREGLRAVPLDGRTVIIVDDGIATGGTMRAAVRAVRRARARRIVVAVPVVEAGVLGDLEPLVDRVVCLRRPRHLDAVGAFYRDFEEVSDGEIVTLLAGARSRRLPGLPAMTAQ